MKNQLSLPKVQSLKQLMTHPEKEKEGCHMELCNKTLEYHYYSTQ